MHGKSRSFDVTTVNNLLFYLQNYIGQSDIT